MPVITGYRHGTSAGRPPSVNSHPRAKREKCQGWTDGATRRNTRFLQSVDESRLDGAGMTFTGTLRDCPPTPADWHRVRKSFLQGLTRMGATRIHWATEWQRRGVPHIHLCAYFPPDAAPTLGQLTAAWMSVAAPYRPTVTAQAARLVSDALGWFQYVAKHTARGAKHYQRNQANAPESWQGETGRMWGHSAGWPLAPVYRWGVDDAAFYRYRRLVRSWRKADARGNRHRTRSARTMLKCSDYARSQCRGVSEWLPEQLQTAMFAHLAAHGARIVRLPPK
jgi:hypothetical protein